MSLHDLVAALKRPERRDGFFSTSRIPLYQRTRVGVDAEGCVAVFFELKAMGGQRRSFLMTSVRYDPVLTCRFDASTEELSCAVLRCTTQDATLTDLFLRIVESWLPTTSDVGVGVVLDDAVASLVDLFDMLGRPGRGEVLGLWGELLLICGSDAPNDVLAAWRSDPFELHDFVSGRNRLEVKTATGGRRHHFSMNQLQPPLGTTLTVCSLVAKASGRGLCIEDLRGWLVKELRNPSLALRVERTIANTLGDRWMETSTQKFIIDDSSGGILFFDGACIPCVDPRIPPEVGDVSFTVECDGLATLKLPPFPGLGALERINQLQASYVR